jgi:phospholipid/cholesterol/gamma-HCH transport system permease protein
MRKLIEKTAELARFVAEVMGTWVHYGVSARAVLDELFEVGVRSVGTVVITGLFVGAIMAMQIRMQLVAFGAESTLGGITSSVTIRQIGPVLIAFVLAGKVGAYTSAELGLMRVTDQIDALYCLGVSPIRFLVLPRLVAVVISSFLLLCLGLGISIVGGVGMAAFHFDVSPEYFVSQISRFIGFSSVAVGIAKSFVFGVILAVVSCFMGYTTANGVSGVGKAVRDGSVASLLLILTADFLMTLLLTVFRGGSGS